MAKQGFAFALVGASLLMLLASGDMSFLPILLPPAALVGYFMARFAKPAPALSWQGKKR